MRSCTKGVFQSRMGTWNLSTHPSSGQQVIKVAECLNTRWQSLVTRYLFISSGGVTSESPRFGGGRAYHRKWRKLPVEGMAAEVEVLRGDRQVKGLRVERAEVQRRAGDYSMQESVHCGNRCDFSY